MSTSSVRLGRPAPSLRDRATRRGSTLRRFDWVLVAAVLALAGLGALLVWSATRQRMQSAGMDPQSFLKRHLINLAIGLVFGLVTAKFDYRMLRAYAPIVYVASCIGLVAVLVVGTTINGAHSWIVIGGGVQVQPAEFAKVGLIVSMAMLLGEKRDGERVPRGSDVVLVLALAAVPMGLVMLQPDFGTTMVLAFVILGVLAVSGASGRWIAGLVLAGLLSAVLAVHLGVLQQYQLDRFKAFTNPATDSQGAGYSTRQARIAIGSGGLTGKGLFKGSQTNGHFVPEQQTDFVFTVAGEELGLLGSGTIILLLGVVLWRGLSIAARAPDLFGRLVATGVAAWFAFQSFVNIGMTLGIMPVTGLPLPFVSYGGSAMFANLMAVGLLLNVHLSSNEP
ncbi:MAG: rod shape-determining protein RodA [Pseudonocardiales bacterium]|nr:MAG: rod shape-determining protein RodA [Pseudonocardiales bacterium]